MTVRALGGGVSHYRVQYAPPADQARQVMPRALRITFDSGMQRLAADPYGHHFIPVKADADRREATVSGAVVRYYVSNAVLTVTFVRVIHV
ncbi:hypothetical protein [Streptomyces caniferus]|uniref:hypothetical protein n=1 Tax=Streptomyces caniferus TaxID=285557 RepID=UPI00383A0509